MSRVVQEGRHRANYGVAAAEADVSADLRRAADYGVLRDRECVCAEIHRADLIVQIPVLRLKKRYVLRKSQDLPRPQSLL